jgi:surfeit locus 1 family protein
MPDDRTADAARMGARDVRVTPLLLEDGTAVLVRRGFVPPVRAGAADPGEAPGPNGEVAVTGYLERSGTQPGFGPRDPADGVVTTVFHADVARIDQQTSAALLPMVLHLTAQDPPPGAADPRPQPAPTIDASSNLNYAFQWIAFTVIAAVGYAIVIWRVRRGVHPTDPAPAAPHR